MRSRVLCTAVLTLAGAVAPALAWDPRSLAGGRLRLGGDASFALAPEDEGFFNYTDYEDSVLRVARAGATAELRAGPRLSLLGEVRTDNFSSLRAYALYARLRPWAEREVDVQVGRIPPVFGAFARRRYGADNPLVGLPLAYQYLTSLRSDAIPASADELAANRGRGWLVRYTSGDPRAAPGLPLAAGLRWDTGAQVRVGSAPLQLSAALTQGTLSNPRFEDDNDGKQLSARLAWQPTAGLVLGASAARGEYLARTLLASLPAEQAGRVYRQQAWGADAEYSRDYWLVRSEVVWSAWDVPALSTPLLPSPLRAAAVSAEGRYKLAPGLWLAARYDHLGFSRIPATAGPITWDAPVSRVELGGGYAAHRHVLVKAAWQRNRRDGGFVRRQDFAVAQVLLWF